AAARHADDHRRRELAAATVTDASELTHDLVVRGIHVIRELDFGDRLQTIHRHADRRGDDTAFGDRRIDHPMLAELLLQPVGAAKHAAEVANVLAQYDDRRVALHQRVHRRVQGLNHVHAWHGSALLLRELLTLTTQM